ncbi:hypothetical protein [Cryptosporangium phraense]|uniref:Uncharacterized protein n=1 Tax=Cryptosporangium phraense TaxID=2593070 RepID=A0A545AEY8_9ACTN|nr:hypothetical protein [Cryptosporangium phraense]TQS39897.1 hypothetical protein FL583_37420 [Cryptosporangium phraense]
MAVAVALAGCSAVSSQAPETREAITTDVSPSSSVAPSPAALREQTTFTLCAEGSYASYAVFRDRSKTKTVKPGSCETTTFPPEHDTTHRADLYGIDPTSGRAFLIGTDWWGIDYDAKVRTTGTAMKPDWFGHD